MQIPRAAILMACAVALPVAATLAVPAQDSPSDDEAASEQVFEQMMERGSQMMGMLGISLKEKDTPASVDAAKQAAAAFGEMYAFFEKKKVADAMQFAKGVQDGFTQAGELAAAGKLEEALAKYQVTRTNCDGCHRAHRTRATDGSYTIKY
jgi:hypothetical protein